MERRSIVLHTFFFIAVLARGCVGTGDYSPSTCFATGLATYPSGFTATFEVSKFMDNDAFCTGCTLTEARSLPSLSLVRASKDQGYSFTLLENGPSPCPCDRDYFWGVLWPDYREFSELAPLTCFNSIVCGATVNLDTDGRPIQTFEPFLSETESIQSTYPFTNFITQELAVEYTEPTFLNRQQPERLKKYVTQEPPLKIIEYVLDQTDVATYTWQFGCNADLENVNARWLELKQLSYLECLDSAIRRSYTSKAHPPRRCFTRNDCYIGDDFGSFLADVAELKDSVDSLAADGAFDFAGFADSKYWLYSANCFDDENVCVTTLTVLPAADVEEASPKTENEFSEFCYSFQNRSSTSDFVPMLQSSVDVTRENSRISLPFLPDIAAYNPCKFSSRFDSSEDYPTEFYWNPKSEFVETCNENLQFEFEKSFLSARINTMWSSEKPPIGPARTVDCYASVACASGYKIDNFVSPLTLVFAEK